MGKKYARESLLCQDFIRQLESSWAIYPEAHGYDIFAVRADGTQLGVQAKLTLNIKVLDQVLPWRSVKKLPDFLGVLVPDSSLGKTTRDTGYRLCRKLGLILLTDEDVHRTRDIHNHGLRWHDGSGRLPVPEFAANTAAGSPCPRTLSPWKIGAIKLGFLLLQKGKMTAAQMKANKQSPKIWLIKGWALRAKRGLYVRGPGSPLQDYAVEGKHLIESLFRD
jgi:hypothetical protein